MALTHSRLVRAACVSVAASAVLCGAAAAQTPARAPAQAKDPLAACEHAAALREAKRTEAAEAAYVAALADPATRPCALAALEELDAAKSEAEQASSPCVHGAALEAADDLEAAKALYVKALAEPAHRACALAAVQRLNAAQKEIDDAKDPCGYGDRLREAGLDEKAEEAYAEAVKKDSTLACASEGLDALQGLDDEAGEASASLGKILALAAEALAGLLLLLFLLALVLGRLPWLRPRLGRWRSSAWLLGPRLKLEAFDGSEAKPAIGAGVTALVKAKLPTTTGAGELDLVANNTGIAASLKDLAAVSPQAGAAVALLSVADYVLPRERFSVSGHLHSAGERGRGLTLALRRGRGVDESWTGWAEELGFATDDDAEAPDVYRQLAIPAASWLGHRMGAVLGTEQRLTSDARSYALVRAGVEQHRRCDYAGAKHLYAQALTLDSGNVAALNNLAVIEGQQEGRWSEAIALLEDAQARLRTEEPKRGLAAHIYDPNWYRVGYNLAVNRLYEASGRPELLLAAMRDAVGVAIDVVEVLDATESWWRGRRHGELRRFLTNLALDSGVVLVGGTAYEDEAL